MAQEPNFAVTTHQGQVIVSRTNRDDCRLAMVPAEVEKATSIIGSVLSMIGMPYLPDHVKNAQFVVRIFKDQETFALERVDQPGSIPFRAVEGDELINVLNMGLGIVVNEQIHGKPLAARSQFQPDLGSDDPF